MTIVATLVTIFAFAALVTVFVAIFSFLVFGDFEFARLLRLFLALLAFGFIGWGFFALVLWVWGWA